VKFARLNKKVDIVLTIRKGENPVTREFFVIKQDGSVCWVSVANC